MVLEQKRNFFLLRLSYSMQLDELNYMMDRVYFWHILAHTTYNYILNNFQIVTKSNSTLESKTLNKIVNEAANII